MNKLWRDVRCILGIVGLLGIGAVAYFFYEIHQSISKLNDVPLLQANYEPAALELAMLHEQGQRADRWRSRRHQRRFAPCATAGV
jgi:hypothetical protein